MTERRWLPWGELARSGLNLFCLPYAGGSAAVYRSWVSEATQGIAVLPVELPGRGTRLREHSFTEAQPLVDAFVSDLAPVLRGSPFALFGHSMGGLLALCLARTLEARGLPRPRHLFISATRPPIKPSRGPISHLPKARLVERLRELNGTPAEVLSSPELMEFVLPYLRSDFALCEAFPWGRDRPVSPPMTIFAGSEDDHAPIAAMANWAEFTSARADIHVLAGDHFFLNHHRRAILDLIERRLASYLTTPRQQTTGLETGR